MPSPFEFINSFNSKAKYLLESELDEKDYSPWIINKGLTFTMDTVMFANEVNKMYGLDKKLQHDFYFYGIPKGKRFGKWQKKAEESNTLKQIMDIYSCNLNVAMQYINVLSEEQLHIIHEKFEQGGKQHGRRK